MGACAYYMKAKFPSAVIAKKAEAGWRKLVEEGSKAEDWWQAHRDSKPQEFWPEFEKLFPLITEYTKQSGLFGGNSNNDLAGELDFGRDPDNVFRTGTEVGFCEGECWHLASWDHYADFIKVKYGAAKVVWDTEENGCGSLDSLQLYDYYSIVQLVLKQKKLLPLLMGLNKDLDELIEPHLKGKKHG